MHRFGIIDADMDQSTIGNGVSDLDPLIKTSIGTKGIILNKREIRANNLEKWGRARLAFVSMSLFFLIYICFAVRTWSEQHPQIIVNIPPNDETLPGPKGMLSI